MRTLIAFCAICLALAATAAWLAWSLPAAFVRPSPLGTAANASAAPCADPPPAPDVPAEPLPGPAASPGDPAPSPKPATAYSPGEVRFPDPPERRAAHHRLKRALDTLSADPDHPPALADAAAALADLKLWPAAVELLDRLVKLEPGDPAARGRYAAALMQVRRFSDALAQWKVLVEWDPADERAWFNLAVVHQALGHLAEARQAWGRVIELSPSPAAFSRRGEVLLDLHEWDAAAADFERVLAVEPADEAATLNLSLARWRGGQVEAARALLDARLAAEPCDVRALNRLAEMAWEVAQDAAATPAARCAAAGAAAERWRSSLACRGDQPEVRDLLAAAESAAR